MLYTKTMSSDCLKCRKNTHSKNVRTKNGTILLLWKGSVCNSN